MTFIREEITSEEDKAIFNSFNFKYPLKNTPINPNVWTIDRQRNVFLAGLGGGALKAIYRCFMC